MRIVAVADTDSYVKWGGALVADPRVDGALVVLDTELVVSDAQLRAATAGIDIPVRRAGLDELAGILRGCDAVLVAARGPVARVVARTAARIDPRPVIVTGLPGISVPATWRALHFRRQCDLFVLHSHREVREFGALARERGIAQSFALATLPFARPVGERATAGTDLVFAAQAIVPREREDRIRVARLLVAAAEADPSRRVVVKLRGRPGEHETHRETDSYPELLGERPSNLVLSYAPMSEALATAEGLMTVSSTAAIEAAARGVPVIALDAFGVSAELINVVFEGSGLLGSEDDVIARRFRLPDPGWLEDNYFHDPDADTWIRMLEELVARPRPREVPRISRAREAWERHLAVGDRDRSLRARSVAAVGRPARSVVRLGRRVKHLLRG
ncbi:hypothetical protein GCM10010910_05000 [Microbacterium nanhaiense]|uniref:Uncharacterized protein n=1 Tax=Microbacterium nanhaiense TaxID=1301026 RepID=A0ABQ2MWP3_9MICO|nr:DUF6716 putative glycosyltransferase [Microbacterium nanhaiense]GGO60196.1 hypothetical protein GCM10010910_05000 [Microbacterium nanhaiense]